MKDCLHTRRYWTVAVCLGLACCLFGCKQRSSTESTEPIVSPNADGVVLAPSESIMEQGREFMLTFPRTMVEAEVIDKDGQTGPLVFEPSLDGRFLWKSQTEGVFRVTGVPLPGITYRAKLRDELHDLAGERLHPTGWGARFKCETFSVYWVEDCDRPRG